MIEMPNASIVPKPRKDNTLADADHRLSRHSRGPRARGALRFWAPPQTTWDITASYNRKMNCRGFIVAVRCSEYTPERS